MNPRGSRWYRVIRWVVRYLMFPLLGGIRVRSEERVPMEGALIVAPNHASFLDPPVIAVSLRRAVTFMAKEELFRPPVFGPLIRSLGAFPVRRGGGDVEAIKTALRVLREGRAILMFPEGRRGDGSTMLPLTGGVAGLAQRTGAHVVPAAICGSERVLPAGRTLPRPHRIRVVYGEPFTFADVVADPKADDARAVFNHALAERIRALAASVGYGLRVATNSSGPPGSETTGTDTEPQDRAPDATPPRP